MSEIQGKEYIVDDKALMDEWDWEKNNSLGIDPRKISRGSRIKAWWICKKGHSYDARISNKAILHRGCPVCSGKRVVSGINDLATCYPDIAAEWDYGRNGELNPNEIVSRSNKLVWWKCSVCGNSWKQSPNHRTARHTGCPFCSGRNAIPGTNDLLTVNPVLAAEWHPTKNKLLTPSIFLPKSNAKVWWKCNLGHEWIASISDRSNGTGCPVCSGKVILVGFNDLQTTHPKLIQEWDYIKNKPLLPTMVSHGSHRKVWWKCSKGHEWQDMISNRVRGNHDCPICGNQQLLLGYNDLATTAPHLAAEWHQTKNELSPNDVFQNTNKKVWWMCRKGHEWQASPNDRTQGNGCPICSGELQTSFPEQGILFYFSKVTTALSREKIYGVEVDIFLPLLKTGIEYNGKFFHQGKKAHDKNKYKILNQNGIRLVTVCEADKNTVSKDSVLYIYNAHNYFNFDWAVSQLFYLIGLPLTDIDTKRDALLIHEQYITLEKENSLATKFPQIAKEWHPNRNGRLTPEMLSYQSNIKVWWLGSCGHEWYASVSHRVNGRGCPYCANIKVLDGFNDLSTTNPGLAKEWNYIKNGNLTPKDITSGSSKKVWWICSEGHEWQATICSRNNGNGCPYCSGRVLMPGINDFLSAYPDIAKEWHPTKNGDLTPDKITARNSKKVWWLCSQCGHEWETRVVHRANGHGCPICARKRKHN